MFLFFQCGSVGGIYISHFAWQLYVSAAAVLLSLQGAVGVGGDSDALSRSLALACNSFTKNQPILTSGSDRGCVYSLATQGDEYSPPMFIGQRHLLQSASQLFISGQ